MLCSAFIIQGPWEEKSRRVQGAGCSLKRKRSVVSIGNRPLCNSKSDFISSVEHKWRFFEKEPSGSWWEPKLIFLFGHCINKKFLKMSSFVFCRGMVCVNEDKIFTAGWNITLWTRYAADGIVELTSTVIPYRKTEKIQEIVCQSLCTFPLPLKQHNAKIWVFF